MKTPTRLWTVCYDMNWQRTVVAATAKGAIQKANRLLKGYCRAQLKDITRIELIGEEYKS